MNTTMSRRDPLLAELDAMTDSFERMFGLRAAPGGNRGGDVAETVTMDYDDIEFEYKEQKSDGSLGGSEPRLRKIRRRRPQASMASR